jgi:hypothetical protein
LALLAALLNFSVEWIIPSDRPLHPDEAMVAMRALNPAPQPPFAYEPAHDQGPFFFILFEAVDALPGLSDTAKLRLIPALSKSLSAFTPLLALPWLSLSALWLFGLLLLISPYLMFYGGSFIHMQGLLVLFVSLSCFSGYAFYLKPKMWTLGIWLLSMLGLFLTHNVALLFGTALILVLIPCRFLDAFQWLEMTSWLRAHTRAVFIGLGVCTVLFVWEYSSHLRNIQALGVFGSFLRFSDSPSWISLFFFSRTEALTFLIAAGSGILAWKNRSTYFFAGLGLASAGLLMGHPNTQPLDWTWALIPWMVLITLASARLPRASIRVWMVGVTSLALGWSLYLTHGFFTREALKNPPFSQRQASKDYQELAPILDSMAQIPQLVHASGWVWTGGSYWPLPFYLRNFQLIQFKSEKTPWNLFDLRQFQLLVLPPEDANRFRQTLEFSPSETSSLPTLYEAIPFEHWMGVHLVMLIRADVWMFLPDAVKLQIESFRRKSH